MGDWSKIAKTQDIIDIVILLTQACCTDAIFPSVTALLREEEKIKYKDLLLLLVSKTDEYKAQISRVQGCVNE